MAIDKKKVSFSALKRNFSGNFDGFALSDQSGQIISFDMPQGFSPPIISREVLQFMGHCPFAVSVNKRGGTFLDAILLDSVMNSGTAICLDREDGFFLFFNSMREKSADAKLIRQIEKWAQEGILGRLLTENGEKK